jgi:hypothetical protein
LELQINSALKPTGRREQRVPLTSHERSIDSSDSTSGESFRVVFRRLFIEPHVARDLLDVMSLERRDTKKAFMASGGAERIGALPDDLLHHVLSFLPAHEVVRTCLLARRWRHLWKSAAALRITGVKGCKNAAWFVNFVDNLLFLRDPRVRLESFELDLDERDFDFEAFLPANEAHVNTWFRHAVMCGPRVLLALRTTTGIYMYPEDHETNSRVSQCPTHIPLPHEIGTHDGVCAQQHTRFLGVSVVGSSHHG